MPKRRFRQREEPCSGRFASHTTMVLSALTTYALVSAASVSAFYTPKVGGLSTNYHNDNNYYCYFHHCIENSYQHFRHSNTRNVVQHFSVSDVVEAEWANDVDISKLTQSTNNGDLLDNSKFPLSPPWLRRMNVHNSDSSDGNDNNNILPTPRQAQNEIKWLEFSLMEHGIIGKDVSDIVKAIYLCTAGDISMILGSIDFIKLLLCLEEPSRRSGMLVTKEVLIACILHYTECANARLDGIYQKVEKAIRLEEYSSAASENSYNKMATGLIGTCQETLTGINNERNGISKDEDLFCSSATSLRKKLTGGSLRAQEIDVFSPEALRLASGAAQIKRAEILADVILTDSRALTQEEYSRVRDLLVSVMDDWRALAIRCVASLYRLEGVLGSMPPTAGDYRKRSLVATLAARNSIRVYANLSQRLGLHRLKTQLEAGAFKVLYPRQYSAVSALFQEKGESMKAVTLFLTDQIKKMLRDDEFLKSELEYLDVSSRVKEPYSFWKKILKKRKQQKGRGRFLSPGTEISLVDIHDGVALRVILKARKKSADESVEITRKRERMLCYYVHHLIRSRWPATDPSRIKDYIRNPKRNGYQSLHHTASIVRNNQMFPFEVQVRSDEMHRIAEYGVAAHWDYKLGEKPAALLPPFEKPKTELNEKISHSRAATSSYINALENARHALVRSNVFVFLGVSTSPPGNGQLLSLPSGAQVIDLLAQLDESGMDIGSLDDIQVWRNGHLALLNDTVRNGDVIILTHENGDQAKTKCLPQTSITPVA